MYNTSTYLMQYGLRRHALRTRKKNNDTCKYENEKCMVSF